MKLQLRVTELESNLAKTKDEEKTNVNLGLNDLQNKIVSLEEVIIKVNSTENRIEQEQEVNKNEGVEINKKLKVIQKKLNELEENKKLDKEIIAEETRIVTEMKDKFGKVEKQVIEAEKVIEKVIEKKIEQKNEEDFEKEFRKKNLILFGVEELDSVITEERVQNDIQRIDSIFETIKIRNVKILKYTRLGKRTLQDKEENESSQGKVDTVKSRVRPLRITLEDDSERYKIIENAKLLKESSLENVFISFDLTRKERDEKKKLRNELELRKSKGEKNLVIKRGRIVHLKPGQFSAMKK
jgi:hypothetical protein